MGCRRCCCGLLAVLVLALSAFAVVAFYSYADPVWLSGGHITLTGPSGEPVIITRTPEGVPVIKAQTPRDMAYGLGYVHGMDRGAQLYITKIVAYGRVTELLVSAPKALELDVSMRRLDLARVADEEMANSGPLEDVEAYAEGVNAFMISHVRPIEFLIVGYKPDAWSLRDCLAVTRMADYTGLMELNGDLKLSLTSLVRFADDPSQGNKVLAWLLSHLFDYNAVPLDKEFFDSLRSVKDVGNIAGMVPPVGQFHASNNWAVSSKRSATGNAIYSSDPHLRVDLLPAVVGEFIAVLPDNFVAGFSLVGGPAIIISRSKYVSMGLTYGMQDSTDIFLEQCEGSSCRDGDEMVPIKFREELFPQKGGSLVKIFMPHTKNGLINLGQQHHPLAHNLSSPPVLEKGSYFTYMFPYWIPHKSTWGLSVQKILNARTVSEMAEYLRTLDIGANWLVVDNSGHIAYQQSGFVGKRDFIGLPVRPGWDSRFAWRGFFEQSALHSIVDPPDGILVTANNMISDPNGQRLISYDLGPFRAGRIREELNKKEKLTIEDMKTEQGDTFSLLCSDLMGIARPVIPADTQDPNLRALLDFDCRFRRGSQGATVFVYFLREVWALALSPLGGNAAVWSDITSKVTSRPLMHRLVMEFPAELDEALWHGQTRQQLLGKALNITAALFSGKPARPYVARYKAKNTVFMGTLPSWLGFDRMVEAEGCQDSPGAVYFDTVTADENSKAVAACLRFVADMSQDETYESIVSGGPSGRPFSPWYSSELTRWQNFKTKVVNITAAIASTAVKQKAEV